MKITGKFIKYTWKKSQGEILAAVIIFASVLVVVVAYFGSFCAGGLGNKNTLFF